MFYPFIPSCRKSWSIVLRKETLQQIGRIRILWISWANEIAGLNSAPPMKWRGKSTTVRGCKEIND